MHLHIHKKSLCFSRGSSPVPAGGPQFDVQGGDAQLLAPLSYILSSQHGSVGRGLVSVGLHLHPAGHTADCFSASKRSECSVC